jgi:hypothetical protein
MCSSQNEIWFPDRFIIQLITVNCYHDGHLADEWHPEIHHPHRPIPFWPGEGYNSAVIPVFWNFKGAVMQDMRYFRDEGRYLDQAWDVYREYFASQNSFLFQYKKIPSNERKDLFLKILSRYKLLVRDGEYRIIEDQQELYVGYLDETYKFISIMSLIEALFAEEEHVDFYQWLMMKKRKRLIFPITDEKVLDDLYREYKMEHGARRVVRFFRELDEGAQRFLAARIRINNDPMPAEVLAQKLYIMRSEFVHQARPVLEFNDGSMFSRRHGNVIYSMLSIKDLQLLFEHGLLNHFCIPPETRKI